MRQYDFKLKTIFILCSFSVIQRGNGEQLVKLIETACKKSCKFYPIAYGLAVCARSTNQRVSQKAYNALQTVCRTPEQLFMFLKYCQESLKLKSWPRRHRKAIAKWYTEKYKTNPNDPNDPNGPMLLAQHITKYRRRHGFSHKKVLKSCHPKSSGSSADIKYILCYVVKGLTKANQMILNGNDKTFNNKIREFITDYETIKKQNVPEDDVTTIIRKWRLTWEQVPNRLLKSEKVLAALLPFMPLTALLRHLGKLTSFGLLQPCSEGEESTCSRLENEDILRQANLHPIQILSSLNGYFKGRRLRNPQLRWSVNDNIVQSLTKAYMKQLTCSCQNPRLPPNILVAINIRRSMGSHVAGKPVMNCKQTATALAMTLKSCQSRTQIVTFCNRHTVEKLQFQISEGGIHDIEEALENVTARMENDLTDFNEPFRYANQNMGSVDAIILMTDCLTWRDQSDIRDAYRNFKQRYGDISFVTVGFHNNGEDFPVAERQNPKMLDVIGPDAEAIDLIVSFLSDQDQQIRESFAGLEIYAGATEEDMDQD